MATRHVLRIRAEQLRSQGLTSHRAFRVLCIEFPNAERDSLVDAARIEGARTFTNPTWTTWGRALRPTQIRFQQKGAPRADDVKVIVTTKHRPKRLALHTGGEDMQAPTITIDAKEVMDGDWIEGHGEVGGVAKVKQGFYFVFEDGGSMIVPTETRFDVRLEDPGKEGINAHGE